MQQEVLGMVLSIAMTNQGAVFDSKLLRMVNDVIKINREGVGRVRITCSEPITSSTATNIAGSVSVRVIRDEDLDATVREVVEGHVLSVLNDS